MSELKPSLLYKLNLQMLGSLLSGMILVNLGVFIIFMGLLFYNLDGSFAQIIESLEEETIESDYYELGPYYASPISKREFTEVKAEWEKSGWRTKVKQEGQELLAKITPLKEDQLIRTITSSYQGQTDVKISWRFLGQRIRGLDYRIYPEISGRPYLISYDLGKIAHQFYLASSLILLLEIIFVLGQAIKGARRIRRTLRPLTELAAQTREINYQLQNYGPSSGSGREDSARDNRLGETRELDGERILEELQGELAAIDGSQLDQRISLDSSHRELQGLTQAINMMLARIDQSYQAQIRFVSDASHELRTPIAVIQGYANLLDRWGKDDPETRQEAIDAIKSEAQQMKDLIEHLLFLARGDNDSIKLQLEEIDLTQLMTEINQEANLIGVSHEIVSHLRAGLVVEADRQLLKQALRILLDNAIKYSPEDQAITIRTESGGSRGQGLAISIQDQGIGIPAGDLPHVFDRFYRSDESRARESGGTGLGLAIVKWIVESHQGELEIFSLADVGTRITINL